MRDLALVRAQRSDDEPMKRLVPLLLPLAVSGCVGYPRPYMTRVKGQADLQGGPPIRVEAGIAKTCDSMSGETEDIKNRRGETTDKDGRYSFTVMGVVWHFKNLVTEGYCTSHIQKFVCREHCRKADDIDIEVLGK